METQQQLKMGDAAPNFVLKDHHNKELRLSELKGRKILLSFHPLAWTKVCAEQMKSLEQNSEVFDRLNTVPLGLSVDTVPSKHAWAHDLGLKKTRLLSDFWPHGTVAKLYGLFREENGLSGRANIIIDEDQKIVFLKLYEIPQLPDIDEIIASIRK